MHHHRAAGISEGDVPAGQPQSRASVDLVATDAVELLIGEVDIGYALSGQGHCAAGKTDMGPAGLQLLTNGISAILQIADLPKPSASVSLDQLSVELLTVMVQPESACPVQSSILYPERQCRSS